MAGATFSQLLYYLFVHSIDEVDVEDSTLRTLEADELRERIWILIEENNVSREDILEAVASLFRSYTSWPVRYNLLQFIDQLEARGFHMQEMFWVILESGVLFDVEDVSDVAIVSGVLAETGSSELVRYYLVSILNSGDSDRRRSAIKAFYPVGHSISSLKSASVSLSKYPEQELKNILYQHALFTLGPEDRRIYFSEGEMAYLTRFFEEGLASADSGIQRVSQIALNHLERA